MKDYLVVEIELDPVQPAQEILVALLDELDYDSFEETQVGLKAYILEADFKEEELKNLPYLNSGEVKWTFKTEKLETINWNEEWERNYEPVYIEDEVQIRAPFHPKKEGFKHEVIIEPKMSFGTGHHQTTRLMSLMMMTMNFADKEVLDMGTGTGVLAILAEKLGARQILAIDNFEWAATNTAENAERNTCIKIQADHGDAASIKGMNFDIVLANINRNVLLQDMNAYSQTLSSGGSLVMSGYFDVDFGLINKQAEKLGFALEKKLSEKNWICCHYIKQ